MPIYVSPEGNPEVWEVKPDGYYEVDEWDAQNPPSLPTECELTQQRITEIQQLLTANDLASVRPLRAKVAGRATEEDEARLEELEDQAEALREELAALNIKLDECLTQDT
ncbi:DUF5320 domain-containing protein [Halodesulfovibrio aestuarii]|uniref:Uncharacterized protein n=1 Tax=Halodesulfovibrio aestuarii TaxID=126333 RepID=A0A8G2C8I5_9BACT|nr:DUF5320 domain-containing protein [Halodesulfovibrio aestuarii]SHI82104.1 hypothetical protein SAMN05660830_01105 [Halodesulfovibrio aestuarii]